MHKHSPINSGSTRCERWRWLWRCIIPCGERVQPRVQPEGIGFTPKFLCKILKIGYRDWLPSIYVKKSNGYHFLMDETSQTLRCKIDWLADDFLCRRLGPDVSSSAARHKSTVCLRLWRLFAFFAVLVQHILLKPAFSGPTSKHLSLVLMQTTFIDVFIESWLFDGLCCNVHKCCIQMSLHLQTVNKETSWMHPPRQW